MARDHRRLAAIVSADVVGYSLLMGRDDSATLAGLKAHRRELIDPKIAEYGGRIVKTTGDGLLLEFPSVVDAVHCAVGVQRGMAERNAGVAPEQRIEFRIGINVGDIIIDGDDIFGDGVNVAARLQTLAEPGGICVSRVVRDQVLDKLSFAFEDLGPQEVKNIARPVDVYKIDLAGGSSSPRTAHRLWYRLTHARHRHFLIASVLLIGLIAIGAWWLLPATRPNRGPSPPVYSIVVLPFTTGIADAANNQLAETVSADLTSSLTRAMPWASVVSSSVAGSYKGKSVDARAIGRELNIRYLVEGTVRGAGDRADIRVWLTDASTGTEMWSASLELPNVANPNDRQTFITQLTNQVGSAVGGAVERRVLALPISALNAAELAERADATLGRELEQPSLTTLAEARSLYDKALQLDPTLPNAMMGQANVLAATLDRDPQTDRNRLLDQYDKISLRLITVNGREARTWAIRADALQRQWRWEAALEANARARKLDPTFFGAMGQYADILIDTGRPEDALPVVDQAFSLQPGAFYADWLFLLRCRAQLAIARYDDAIQSCEKSTRDWPRNSISPPVILVAAYALQGNDSRAQTGKTRLLALRPGFSIALIRASRISDVPAYLEQTETHLYAGLRKAGIPEN